MILRQFLHADHLSAGREPAQAAGAEYVLSAEANVSFPFKGVRDPFLSGEPWSTIGVEKRHNQALGIESEAGFIRFMLADIPPAPAEAARIRSANSGYATALA